MNNWTTVIFASLLLIGFGLPTATLYAQTNKPSISPKYRLSTAEVAARPDHRYKGMFKGGMWMIDRRTDGTGVHYWKGKRVATSTSILKDDTRYTKRSDGREETCAEYHNPGGSKEALDEFIAVCEHGTFPYAVFPMPASSQDSAPKNMKNSALSSYMEMTRPEGAGPFPAVMMISGCSGFSFGADFYDDVQKRITKLGFLVIRVDSLRLHAEARCDGGGVSVDEQVADIQAAATFLRDQDNVKKAAINVLGWSWGGGGSLAAAMAGNGIHAAVAYYPACRNLPATAVTVPTLILHGEADNVVSLKACEDIISKSETLVLRTYPDAHHAFDSPALDPPREYRFGTLGYNRQAAAAAWGDTGLPYPATAADLTVASVLSTNISAQYSGGATDYTAGECTLILTLERIA